jgi:CheY-like chemotaxis protein
LQKSRSGIEVIQQIRNTASLGRLPIILTTAAAFVDAGVLRRLHVTLVEKPFDVDRVVEIIKQLTQLCPQSANSSFY